MPATAALTPSVWQSYFLAIRNLRLLATVSGEAVYVHLSIGQRGYVMSICKNKIAIVTGAASGIGQALARDLARQGADVVLADVQIDAANTVAAGVYRSGGKASAHYLTVTDSDAVEGFVRRASPPKKGRLDANSLEFMRVSSDFVRSPREAVAHRVPLLMAR
jgi:hypothetical protein